MLHVILGGVGILTALGAFAFGYTVGNQDVGERARPKAQRPKPWRRWEYTNTHSGNH